VSILLTFSIRNFLHSDKRLVAVYNRQVMQSCITNIQSTNYDFLHAVINNVQQTQTSFAVSTHVIFSRNQPIRQVKYWQ